MNKKDVLDKIKKDTGCDDDRAEEIFQRALHGIKHQEQQIHQEHLKKHPLRLLMEVEIP